MVARVLSSLVLSVPLVGAYGIFAIGIALMYQASRMLNLAHGTMAMVPAYLLYSLVESAGAPVVMALPIALASGGALGFLVQKVFVARLRAGGPTAQTVGTVAALGVLTALMARVYGTSSLNAVDIFPRGSIPVGFSVIRFGDIGLFVVLLVVSAALFVLIQRTDLGLMMRGTAESRLAASLMGVNPSQMISLAWILGGTLAALGGILLAAVTALHPYNLSLQVLPAFIAALIGGMGSLGGAVVGAAIVGVTQGMVPLLGSVGDWQGAPQLALAVTAMAVMAFRGGRLAGADQTSDELVSDVVSAPDATKGQARPRPNRRRLLVWCGVGAAVVFPFVGWVPTTLIGSINLGASYVIIAVSLVLLIGWVGQISLGHAAFVGVGAYATGFVISGAGIPFPFSLPLAAAVTAGAAALLGAVALRVRGLFLAVATLVFGWMANEFLFRHPWVSGHSSIPAQVLGTEGSFPSFDLTNRRIYYLVAWATAAAVIAVAANMRDSRTGRAFFALRGSELAAASLGIDVTRYKLLAFAASGAIAGVGGSLMITDFRVVSIDQFTFSMSLFFLAIAVVGGLRSLPGAVAAGLLFAGLQEVFFQFPSLGAFLELTSAVLLAFVLLAWRGGLASIPGRLTPVGRRVVALWGLAADRARRLDARLTERAEGRRAAKATLLASSDEVEEAEAEEVVLREESHEGSEGHTKTAGRSLRLWRRKEEVDRELPLDFSALSTRSAAASEEWSSGSELSGQAMTSMKGRGSSPSRRPVSALDDTAQLEPAPSAAHAANGERGEPAHQGAHADQNAHAALRAELASAKPEGPREDRRLLIEAEGVTVKFGGLTAVNDAFLQVREGEIVGLIGPNGAGKTTFFNAIAGYNSPASGTIRLYGKDVTSLPVHKRAEIGVARTFQHIQLFGDLSVHDNLLVATHVHNPTGVLQHMVVSAASQEAEITARERVRQVIELLELSDVAHVPAASLPFGVLRMVELGRAMVTGFRVIMLDEPASGLDDRETDGFMDVLRLARGLGVTLLLIEHDIRMVTSVSDHLYVINQGEIIADGPPAEIQRNPEVIAAYLGEPAKDDEREEVGA